MTKRKVRKDFDKNQPITVDVSNSSVEEKKKVQQAFFDAGIVWVYSGVSYANFNTDFFTNDEFGDMGECLTPEEFYYMVYEDEDKEMEGYTKVDDLNSFKWMLKDTSKEVYIEFIKRGVLVEAFHNFEFENMDFCHNFWGCVVSSNMQALEQALVRYKNKGCKEVFFQDGEFWVKNNAIDFNYEEYCKGGYVVKTVGGMIVTQVKRFDLGGDFPIAGVVSDFLIDTWSDKGVHCSLNSKNNNLVMYKV